LFVAGQTNYRGIPEALVRTLLIRTHQPRVARDVGSEDSGEAAERGHFSPSARFGLAKSTVKPAVTLALR
jgi:hypothetical protein